MATAAKRHLMKTYLLPCGCSASIEVGPGQAGGLVTCQACGATVPVPRLGELARLPSGQVPTRAASTWTAAHACLLGGGIVAALALAAAAYLGSAPAPLFDVAEIRASVAAAPTPTVYQEWRHLARSGVARPTLPHEQRLVAAARSGRALAAVLLAVAAAGAAAAGGGWIALAGRRGARP